MPDQLIKTFTNKRNIFLILPNKVRIFCYFVLSSISRTLDDAQYQANAELQLNSLENSKKAEKGLHTEKNKVRTLCSSERSKYKPCGC